MSVQVPGSSFIVKTRLVGGEHVQVLTAAPTTTTPSRPDVSTSAVTLLAADPNRVGAVITNNSDTARLYVRVGAGTVTAAKGGYDYLVEPRGQYILDAHHTDAVSGIWDVADAAGFASVLSFAL